jgi:hypothetical protein
LDEITQRLKKKLRVVTNEGFTAPLVHSIHETENSFRSEAARHTVSNIKDGKSAETAAVSSVNEQAYEGKLVLKITNLSQCAVGFNIFLTVHLRIILVSNQLDAQFLLCYIYLNPLHVSSNSGGQLYEYNFWYNHSVLVAVRYAGEDGTGRPLTQSDYTRSCIHTFVLPSMST